MTHVTILLAAVLLLLFWSPSSNAQNWYPNACCPDYACAPVDKFRWIGTETNPQALLWLKSKFGQALIRGDFPHQHSKDGRMHVCMMYDSFGDQKVTCLFLPPVT